RRRKRGRRALGGAETRPRQTGGDDHSRCRREVHFEGDILKLEPLTNRSHEWAFRLIASTPARNRNRSPARSPIRSSPPRPTCSLAWAKQRLRVRADKESDALGAGGESGGAGARQARPLLRLG